VRRGGGEKKSRQGVFSPVGASRSGHLIDSGVSHNPRRKGGEWGLKTNAERGLFPAGSRETRHWKTHKHWPNQVLGIYWERKSKRSCERAPTLLFVKATNVLKGCNSPSMKLHLNKDGGKSG